MISKIEAESIISKKTVGYWSALGGIEVKAICGDSLQCVVNAWNGKSRAHHVSVKYAPSGRAYVLLYGSRYYLDECIRA